MNQAPYRVEYPTQNNTSMVFACPHSGRAYPPEFLRKSVLDEHQIRSSEDAFVDLLYADVPKFGAPLFVANTPRAFVDLNRAKDEFDPALIRGVRGCVATPRVAAGLGVIPRVVANGRAIQNGKMHQREADQRIRDHWQPYHDMLSRLLASAHQSYGRSILIDCHSMPHEATGSAFRFRKSRPDIVLGDRHGASAHKGIVDFIEAAFTKAGLVVARNQPFAGAYIAQHYGRPARGRHVVQIEIDRALYMNERTISLNANFETIQSLISKIVANLVQYGGLQLPLAAE